MMKSAETKANLRLERTRKFIRSIRIDVTTDQRATSVDRRAIHPTPARAVLKLVMRHFMLIEPVTARSRQRSD
jgi:hypothetical protein